MNTETTVGTHWMCTKTVNIDSSGEQRFTQGKIYTCEYGGCLTNDVGNKNHIVSPDFLAKHFTQYNHSRFDDIRTWAKNKGILDNGDSKTQTVKLLEEAGELAAAVLRGNSANAIDAIGDIVVALTSLAHHQGTTIEECIEAAYDVIKGRTGKMVEGDFQKDVTPTKEGGHE